MTPYRIYISLSHRQVAFRYWLRDEGNRFLPLGSHQWPAPMAFYCTDSDIIIGHEAFGAAASGTSGSFLDYFKLANEGRTYSIRGEEREAKYLFVDAAETLFQEFFRSVVISSLRQISFSRVSLPLTIVCDSDITPDQRKLIKSVFAESGYQNVEIISFDDLMARYIPTRLAERYEAEEVLVAYSEGDDLCLSLYDIKGEVAPVHKVFPHIGIDPRLNYVKEIIWERVSGQNPYLVKETELEAIDRASQEFINSDSPMVDAYIVLSDGHNYRYSLVRSDINFMECPEAVRLRNTTEFFLRDNGVTDNGKVLLIRREIAGESPFFEINLGKGYSKDIVCDAELYESIISQTLPKEDAESTVRPHGVHDILGRSSRPIIQGRKMDFNHSVAMTSATMSGIPIQPLQIQPMAGFNVQGGSPTPYTDALTQAALKQAGMGGVLPPPIPTPPPLIRKKDNDK